MAWYTTDKGWGIDTQHVAGITGSGDESFVLIVGKDYGIKVSGDDAEGIAKIKARECGVVIRRKND